ncbi:MAG: thioesterase family protein [Thermoflexaceae bacterium]|nr:thioesterase family protein [Thermoflexaceae bacterium]
MSETERKAADPRKSIDQLLEQLDVQPVADGFIGRVKQDEGRLFGGLVLAQSIMAAGRAEATGNIHSMHAYFLRAGRPAKDITYRVERIRDGRNFTTRRVTALQDGDVIFEASVGFVAPEEGHFAYQEPMPEAPDPEELPSWWESMARSAQMPSMPPPMMRHRNRGFFNPIDIRAAQGNPRAEGLPHRTVWGRPVASLPEDPLIHAAALAWLSDSGMVATVAQRFGMWQPGGATASLDHAIWWHHPPRFDDWVLYATDSPIAQSARALMWGGMYSKAGVRVASVAQEGLFGRRSRGRSGSRHGHGPGECNQVNNPVLNGCLEVGRLPLISEPPPFVRTVGEPHSRFANRLPAALCQRLTGAGRREGAAPGSPAGGGRQACPGCAFVAAPRPRARGRGAAGEAPCAVRSGM